MGIEDSAPSPLVEIVEYGILYERSCAAPGALLYDVDISRRRKKGSSLHGHKGRQLPQYGVVFESESAVRKRRCMKDPSIIG